ncbi:MAG: hypothetical protein R3C52_14470 [Hyphomonadaceae bacterium]
MMRTGSANRLVGRLAIALAAGAALAVAGCTSVPCGGGSSGGSSAPPDVGVGSYAKTAEGAEAYMRAYTETWNRHDAEAVARDFYAFGGDDAERLASVRKMFEGLEARGYDHSDIHAIKACMTGPDTAWAGMRFTRLKGDGDLLGPAVQGSSYDLEWRDGRGWRIMKLNGGDASAPLACPGS